MQAALLRLRGWPVARYARSQHAGGDAAGAASPPDGHPFLARSDWRAVVLAGYGTGADQILVPQLLLASLGCGATYSEAM